jgi:hypothetical protein
MVKQDSAQLFTIEGIVAALIMIGTAYVIVTSTTLYTPADIHVSDMHLEQMANDILTALDTSPRINYSAPDLYQSRLSPLQDIVIQSYAGNPAVGDWVFENVTTLTNRTVFSPSNVEYQMKITDSGFTHSVNSSSLVTGKERMVRATRFVNIPDGSGGYEPVLVELYLWRA